MAGRSRSKQSNNVDVISKETLSDRIVNLLKDRGSLKATEIAQSLQCDRNLVNQALHGPLKAQVTQDSAYRWTAIASGERGKGAAEAAAIAGPLAHLCRYYLDCLAHDAEQGCSVLASNDTGKLDYSPVTELPELRAGGAWTGSHGEIAKEFVQRTRLDRSVALYVGYPVLLRFHQTAKWEGYFVEPILLYSLEKGDGGVLRIADNVPLLNFRALKSLGDGGNVLDDVIALSDELGLSGREEPPALEDIALRLQDIRPDWPWIDSPVLGNRKQEPALSSVTAAGIYNYAVVALGERPNYTQGLETELKELSGVPEEILRSTALGQWIAGTVNAIPKDTDTSLIELIKLNTEQRAAVRSALNAPLTVITGPPGTGKSQVVTALLANCAWQGQQVLFASKNNKAVDVVEERVNGLASRPTLIRFGSRAYEARLAEYLMGLLSATTTPEDEPDYKQALESQKQFAAELARLAGSEQSLIQARNRVDTRESQSEEWRRVFGESLGFLQGVDVAALRAVLTPLQRAIARADSGQAGLLVRLLWFVSRTKRLEQLNSIACQPNVLEAIRQLRLRLPDRAVDDASARAFAEFDRDIRTRLTAIDNIHEYLSALKALSEQPSLESLAKQQAALDERSSENALALWQSWARLQPIRLSQQDRQSLSQYRALLQIVLDSNRAGTPIPAQSWRQYQEIVPKIAHLIPCWAVTSLSAYSKVPFAPAFFDLLVIDEASQCDIASVLPLLYRTKRVTIIGDPKQLTHITKLSLRRDAQLQHKNGLPADMGQWGYSVNSLFDLASTLTSADSLVMLRDHHRSHADIIEFSNRQFYEGRLRVATRYDSLRPIETGAPAIGWFKVQGEVRRPADGSAINEAEAQAVVRLLKRMVLERSYEGTIGVVSPFRAQCNRIRILVNADPTLTDRLGRSEFIAETVHQFQGDERDIMVFSPVVSRGMSSGAIGFLKKNGNLFNVAITRARAALYVVGDKLAARESGVNYLAEFAKYTDEIRDLAGVRQELRQNVVLGPTFPQVAKPQLVSEWERIFYGALYAGGVRAIPQYSVENYLLDFAVIEGERRLDIEVDGERYHRAWDGELTRRDRLRNQRMMELGWDVKRFWVYQIRDQMEWCVGEVKRWVAAPA
jgi:very-short-patch-repair endonuclease